MRYTQRTREPYEEHPRLLTVALPLLDTAIKALLVEAAQQKQNAIRREGVLCFTVGFIIRALCVGS